MVLIVLIATSVLWVLLFVMKCANSEFTYDWFDEVKFKYFRHAASPIGIVEIIWGMALALTIQGELTLASAGVAVLMGVGAMSFGYVLFYHIVEPIL